jgi:uncharacterized protein with GYD domain
MAHYLIQLSYTSDSWAAQVKNPVNRIEAVRPMIESAGGAIECAYYAFGEYDLMLVVRAPDEVAMASISLAVISSGAMSTFRTTPLMTIEDGIEAMKRAGNVGYRPPA